MEIVALLPMKANSQRVRGKNFRDFHGKPLFRWVLDTLLAVPQIDRVVINTDARKMLESHGLVETPKVMIRDRKAEICGDDVSMNLVLADDVAAIPARCYLMTHTTNPLLSQETIALALKKYLAEKESGRADSLFTVNRVQTRFYRADASPVNHDPDNLIPTQNLEPWFEENSNLYIFSPESFAASGARIGKSPAMFEMSKVEATDIDNEDDWQIAMALARIVRPGAFAQ